MHGKTMGKHRFTKLTTAQTWGKPSPPPFIIFFMLGHGAYTQMSFYLSIFLKLGLLRLWKPITSYADLGLM